MRNMGLVMIGKNYLKIFANFKMIIEDLLLQKMKFLFCNLFRQSLSDKRGLKQIMKGKK